MYVPRVLIVDDEPVVRESLEALLSREGYQLVFAEDGLQGLAAASAATPDAILLDVMMPGMDGFEVCRRLRGSPGLAEVPILFITALDDRESRLHGLQVGADDFLSKPLDRAELRARLKTTLRLNRYRQLLEGRQTVDRLHQELLQAYDATLEGWARALDLRDKETEGHSRRVTELTLRLAQKAGLAGETLEHARRGALLHDIGKMGVPDSILLKPGRLDEAELAVMRRHPQLAYDLLTPIGYLGPALDIPYCHHEKWDGSGYPRGLRGTEIPLTARMFALVDVWDALTSDRPYRAAMTCAEALAIIQAGVGTHFDPEVAVLFLQLMAES